MAWNISKAKRQALVKLQLRDKKGRWIEMGGGVKWYSSRLKRQVSGTVVGTKGENALVRLDKQEGQDRSPLVSVAARNITVIDDKATLAPTTMGTPTDKTSKFEGAIPVANEANGAKGNGYVKPSDSPEDFNVSVTSDGRAYVGRKDGAEVYFPARSLEVGDVLVAPEGGDETKPFSIGKGWAKKGVESVNTKGPKTGTVLRIEGDRYAVVQLPDGFTVPDKKHEGEQTDLVTVGLSNSVIKLTDGMKAALGDHINATFDGNGEDHELDDSEEANSDHVGREVPEEEVAAEERDPADVDLTDITDGEETEKAAPITEKAREIDVPQADNSGSDNQSLNENGLTDDEQKMVKAYDRMAQRAYDQGNVENGATYEANANRLRKLGEDRRAGAKADHENTDDTPQKDPQEAERQQKAVEPTPEADNAPEDAPEAPKTNVSLDDLEAQAKADGDTVLYHGGLPEGTTLDGIDLNRNGSQQNKRGRSFGGFYLTDESSKKWSEDYAEKRNGVMHGFAIDKNARIDDRGSQQIDRLSAEDRSEAAKTADVIKGKDLLGRAQYVILNKDVVKGVGETNLKEDKSSENAPESPENTPAPNLEEPDAPAQDEAPEAAPRLTDEMLDYLPEGTVILNDIKGVISLPHYNIDGKNVVLHGNVVKKNGKWSGVARDLDAPTNKFGEAPTIQITDVPKSALSQRYVASVPLSKAVGGHPFDGDMESIRPGDYVTLKNGKKGPFSPNADGSPAITTENHNGFRKLGIKPKDIDRVKQVGETPVARNEEEPKTAPEAPSAPNLEEPNAPATNVPATPEQDVEPAEGWGYGKKTKLAFNLKGSTLDDMHFAIENAEGSFKDPGIRVVGNKAEIYDLDKAKWTLDGPIGLYKDNLKYPEEYPAAERAKMKRVVAQFEKIMGRIDELKAGTDDDRFLDGYDINSDSGIRGLKKTDYEYARQDYTVDEVSPDLLKALPEGSIIVTLDENRRDAGLDYVKIADNQWARSKGITSHEWDIYTDADMWGDPVETGILLPDHPKADYTERELNQARESAERQRVADQKFNDNWEAHKANLEAQKSSETSPEPEKTPEPAPEPEKAPEASPAPPISAEKYAEAERSWDSDQERIDAEAFVPGKDMPTLFKSAVRGNTKTALEEADESARESEYDQGYRMVDGKIEVHDFDRADSSLEDNLGRWYNYQQAFPTRENPNTGGYTGGYTKAKVNSVVNGLEKLRESIRAAKKEHDNNNSEDHKDTSTDAPEAPKAYTPNEAVDTSEAAPEAAPTADGEPDPAIVSHLNENAVLGDDAERRSAGLYLGGARYNAALRDGNVPEHLQDQIDALTGFIDKQPEFGQETKLYRGGQPLGDVENRVGEVITEPAFMSTSLKRSEAEIFAGSGPLMEITARPEDKALSINAAYMTDQSGIPEEYRQPVDVTAREAEMLLKPSTSFEITGVRDENGRKVVEARIVDTLDTSPVESKEAAPELDENGLTAEEARQLEIAREEDYLGGIADKDPESRPHYQKPIDDLLDRGQKRLNGEDPDAPQGDYQAEDGHTVYTENAPGRVPDLKATAQVVKESGADSVHVPISDAPKKDYTPEELEHSFDRREKTGLTDSVFDALPKEYQRFKDQDAPADPINLPEAEADASEAPKSGDRFANLQPTAEEQKQLDDLDMEMDDAVELDDTEMYDKASDAKYDLMEAIAKRNAEEPTSESSEDQTSESSDEQSSETSEEPASESTEESEDAGVHPLDALGIKRRTPEAVAGESYAPTQQQQDVIDAVLGGLDTKVQAMAGTGKTSTLVALSRRIAEQGGQAVYIAFNKTVQEEAVRRMEGLPVEPKTGHAVAHTWAQKNMPHLTIRLGGNDPTRVTATYANGKPKAYAKKRAWTSARAVGDALGIEAGAVKEEGSGIPKSKSNIVLAVKKTVEKFALSDSDTIQTSHVPEVFEIAESDLPKIVDFANDYWDDLKREDGNFRVTHDVYRKFWALSKPDLTDGTGGTQKGANILYIDEAQDTPPVLAKVVADQKMQKVIVGDANQAIYAFAENIDYLSEADGDIELPLNKSWRFGPEVADAGNRFLQMLGSENRVVGGGGPSKVTYDMEDADAVLVRTNAGMIHAVLEETKRDRRVTAPAGTRSNLESLVESVEALKAGYEPEHPHDDLIGYKNWNQVKGAWNAGDNNLNMIVKLFDVVDNYSLSRLKPEQIEEEVARKMADAKKAIDHLVIDVPGHNTIKMVQRDGRTYLEPVDENPYPVDEKGKQKPWGWKEKQYAVSNFSAKLGETRKPWLKDNNLDFGPQQMEYRKKGGLEDVGWTYERGEYFTEDEAAIKRFNTYGGQYDVTVSTAHKSKGLEWDRVRIGWDFIGPREDPKTGEMIWPEDDEYKLGYVALTRAAKEIDPGSLDYVFQYTQPNGGDPRAGKKNITVPEDTTPEPEQVADEPPVDVTPDTEKEADDALVFADPEFTPVPETREAPEATPEPEAAEVPEEVAPEVAAEEAPVYDDLTGLTAEEEAYKDSLIEQAKLMSRAKRWADHKRLVKEYNAMFDKGRERLKLQKQQNKAEEVAPEPVEIPEPEAPTPAPEAPTAPEFNDDGLTPEEAARVANLEKWINDVYKGYGQGNVKKMENELDDLYKRGEKRQNGEPDAEEPIDTTPEFETPAPVSLNPEVEPEAPSPVDGVPVAKPMKKSVPTGRRRGQSTVPDADGGEIKVGDTIKHKKFGDVVVTGVLPGAGRVTFISPKTGKESSVKGDAVSLSKETTPAVAEAAGTRLTGTPGDRVMDPITGKKAFIGADGSMIVTGERVRDIKTGQIGIVQTVYTGADKKASVPVLFPGEKEPRRVRGTQLSHADEGSNDSQTPLPEPQAPEPTPAPEKAPEPAPEAPKPEPEAVPEAPTAPAVDEKTERRRAAIGNAPEGAEVRSKDGGEIYTKITSDVWENTDASDSLTDDEVLEKILNGEGDGKGYIIRTPNPAPVPEPEPAPEPEPEPEVIPEPDTSLSGQALADTITYESTLHMTDGDLADMMSRYADDPIVFDKIMEVMDERDANVFLPVDTSKSGATLDDQPALFDMTIPDPTAKTERKLTPHQKAAEEYQNYVMSQYSKALNDLNGVLLNEAGKANPNKDLEINIFSGSASIARKYASEELLQWWLENGRETLGSFRYRMYGWDNDRKAAQTVRSLGYERGQIARDRSNI